MLDGFSYAEYRALLGSLRSSHANLTFADCAGERLPDRYFILRHDVDFSPEAALEMARLEADHGLRATFFLLLSCRYYNLLSEDFCRVPQELAARGHEVGLHYDARAMERRASGDLVEELEADARLLGRLAGQPIRSIAMHNPSMRGEDPFASTTRFINAYDARFTKEIVYFSDSCGAWRDAAFEALRTTPLGPARLQLLIHPLLWARHRGDRWRRLEDWMHGRHARLTELEAGIRAHWQRHPAVQEHDRRMRANGLDDGTGFRPGDSGS